MTKIYKSVWTRELSRDEILIGFVCGLVGVVSVTVTAIVLS